jgi:hypothetical protein
MIHIANIHTTNSLGKTHTYPVRLPESWTEFLALKHDGRKALDTLINNPVDVAQFILLRGLLKLPKTVFNALPDAKITLFLSHLTWLRPDASPVPMFPKFTYRGKTFHLPKPKLENGRAQEFELADNCFNKILAESDPKSAENLLITLVATLCREENPNTEAVIERGDIRLPLVGRSDVSRRSEFLAGLPETVQVAVFLYFAGCKKYIFDLYGNHIFAQNEADDPDTEGDFKNEKEAPDPRTVEPFGWMGVFMELAENPVNLPQIYDMNIHTLCVWLMRKKIQNDRIREQNTPPTFKNSEE